MKIFKLICAILFIFSINYAKAQKNYGVIADFEILPSYLQNGKIIINYNQETTLVKYSVSYSRPSVFPVTGPYKPVDFKIAIGTRNSDNEISPFSEFIQITNSNFKSGVFIKKDTFSVNIKKSKLVEGKKIYLFYQTADQAQVVAYDKVYDFQTNTTTPGNGNPGTITPPTYTVPTIGAVPFYEYYDSSRGTHFYSTEWLGVNYSTILGYVFKNQEPGTVPLYVYYSETKLKYHYSTQLASNFGDYVSRGIACYVYPAPVTKTRAVIRYFNQDNGDNYLFDGPGTFAGYSLEGIKFYILQNPQATTYPLPEEDTMELYEYYSTSKGEHFYTTLKKDRPDYYYSKVLGYVYSIQKPGSVPLYRYVNLNIPSGNHYYTINQQNYAGYTYEGIVGYVYNNSNTSGTTPVYEYYNSSVVNHYYNTINSSFAGYSNEGIKFYMLPYNN